MMTLLADAGLTGENIYHYLDGAETCNMETFFSLIKHLGLDHVEWKNFLLNAISGGNMEIATELVKLGVVLKKKNLPGHGVNYSKLLSRHVECGLN